MSRNDGLEKSDRIINVKSTLPMLPAFSSLRNHIRWIAIFVIIFLEFKNLNLIEFNEITIQHPTLAVNTTRSDNYTKLTKEEGFVERALQFDYNEQNYFQRAWMGREFPVAQSFSPIQVLTQYIHEHSHTALQNEWSQCQLEYHDDGNHSLTNRLGEAFYTLRLPLLEEWKNLRNNFSTSFPPSCHRLLQRKFMVGVYSCPLESGNRLHRFMNSLLWAILTNRTLLWRYYTYDICEIEYKESDDGDCSHYKDSSKSDCDGLLELASWVPSWEQWSAKFGFHNATLFPIERAQIHRKTGIDKWARPYDLPGISPLLLRTGTQFLPDPGNILSSRNSTSKDSAKLLSLPSSWDRLYRLVKTHGVYFLYGMLFESLFTLRKEFWPPSPGTSMLNETGTHDTYFLHSRHPRVGDDGTYVWPEYKCMEKLLENRTRPCTWYIMSDRQKAIDLLKPKLERNFSCNVQLIDHNSSMSISFSKEHGPYAGAGYWRDWALAIQARTGFISFHMYVRPFVRTSTALMREVIEFRRVLEHFKHYSTDPTKVLLASEGSANTTSTSMEGPDLPIFQTCTNPWRRESKFH